MLKRLTILLFLSCCAGGFAQATATAKASVTIVKPISINKEVDMHFGEIAVNDTKGTVVLAPDGSRSLTGGAALPRERTETATAASFEVKGEAFNYSISMPDEILLSDGTNTMKVGAFTNNSSGNLDEGGESLKIGATLHVNGNQTPGYYQNLSDLKVMVNYN